jgi:methyl-accepting chemotaxis protein
MSEKGREIRAKADPLIAGFFVEITSAMNSLTAENHGAMVERLKKADAEKYIPAKHLLDELLKFNSQRVESIKNQFSESLSNFKYTNLIVNVCVIALSIMLAFYIAVSSIARPLDAVMKNMTALAEGNDVNITLDPGRSDEIGRMQLAMKSLADTVAEAFRLKRMIDDMPTNVLTVDIKNDLKVNYVNNSTVHTLSQLKEYLSLKVDTVIGHSIDLLHKNLAHQRSLLADPKNLPHRAKLEIGLEKMDLLVSAIRNKAGEYTGAMLTWELITAKEAMGESVGGVVRAVGQAVGHLEGTAQALSSMAEETQAQSTAVAAAAEEASSNVSSVAASTEELTASISEISKRV